MIILIQSTVTPHKKKTTGAIISKYLYKLKNKEKNVFDGQILKEYTKKAVHG